MKPLARRLLASVLSAAIVAAQVPATAWAVSPEPKPAEAMKMFKDLGVYKDDADPMKSYLGNDAKLTPIGLALWRSLKSRYNPAEEVETMKPVFDRLRNIGTYNEARQAASARAMNLFTKQFGELDQAPAGSIEEAFRAGGMREALMTGAAITNPPKQGDFMQVEIPDGYEFWDAKGLAFRMTKNQVTTYNRELQKNQRAMNLNLPPNAPQVPETGRYNYEMFQYSFWRLKNQETDYIEAARVDRMIGLAELLGKQYPNDMWFKDKSLEADLIRQAKDKTYNHHGTTYSVFDIVDAKFQQRMAYIEGAKKAVLRFETDMNKLKGSPTITDAQVATMSLDEANALRWLSLTVLETQKFHIKNQSERVDPSAPDAQAIMRIIDQSDLSDEQKRAYKEQGRRMKARLDELNAIVEKCRKALNSADYAGSLDTVQSALGEAQKQLGELSVDYSIYLEAANTGFLAKGQTIESHSWYNLPGHLNSGFAWLTEKAIKLGSSDYRRNMKEIESKSVQEWKDGKPVFDAKGRPVMVTRSMEDIYAEYSRLIASGRREDWAQVRTRIMAMNPDALAYANVTPAEAKLDAVKIAASLRKSNEAIQGAAEWNKFRDMVASYATWTVSIALMAPIARASLNLVGKLSGVGIDMINAGIKMEGLGGLAMRAAGRSAFVVGEIAKHTAARLESLEPSASRVKAVAGDNALAQYLVASGARAASVATRQAMFTGLSGGISAGFTLGTHFWDMATARIGGVNIGGYQLIEPGHTMFSEDWDGARNAAWMGFKGGAYWANESFHPLLGYIGLPSTVFGGTKLAGAMETIGSRGVIGSASNMIRGSAALEAAAAKGELGFLERMAEAKWYTGKPLAAFGLSMADNVAKYALFSQAAGWVGEQYGWYVATNVPVPYVPLLGNHVEEDVERRIKRANMTGHAWLESPAWLLIPTHAAHGARDAGPYMMTREGMKQYDAKGETWKYANAPVDTKLKLDPVKPPVSARLFEARFFGEKPPSEWIVTKQAKELGQLKEVRRVAAEGGIINPIELMGVRNITPGSGEKWRTLHVVEEVQKATYDVAVEALVDQPARSLEALKSTSVKGWGEVTPEMQIEIAKALYRAESSLGRKLPPELSAKVKEVLQPMLDANLPINQRAANLRELVSKFPVNSPALDAVQREHMELALRWETSLNQGMPTYKEIATKLRSSVEAKLKAGEITAAEAKSLNSFYEALEAGLGGGKPSYTELVERMTESAEAKLESGVVTPGEARAMRALNETMLAELGKGKPTYAEFTQQLKEDVAAKQRDGKLNAKEAELLTATYDYILEGDRRFNSFNKTEIVAKRSDVIFRFLENKYAERPEMLKLIKGYQEKVTDWAAGRSGERADGAGVPREKKLAVLIEGLEKDLKAKVEAMPEGTISPSERAALDKALTSVKTSAWVVRDAKGGEIPGWRPKQYVRLMQSFLGEGSHADFVASKTGEMFKEFKSRNKLSPQLIEAVDGLQSDVGAWVKSREGKADGEASVMRPLVARLDQRLEAASKELPAAEAEKLADLVTDIAQLDRQGLHKGILTSGRDGGTVQLFVKAPTSVGKTLLAYEGLLPYLEAEAKASGRKVMFLTFNTKLQAQAEFDFLAFNKLGSEVKFETYEGLKTMIAEGKTKGRNVAEEYLMLQDEMDAAGQQPALTIGMVSGRVSRLNGQTTALNESNAGLKWALERLNKQRVDAADVQAQRAKALVNGISETSVPPKQLAEIKVAAEDVAMAMRMLVDARTESQVKMAESMLNGAADRLNRLAGSLPAAEAEAASSLQSALGRMREALAERPSANPAVRANLAADMQSAFEAQNRLMDLTNTTDGLSRLPGEARKAKASLEARIGALEKNLAEAERSKSPDAKSRAAALREQIEYAKLEKAMVERFDGIEPSARLISIDEQLASIRAGETSGERLTVNSKIPKLMRESVELDAKIEATGKYDAGMLAVYRAETGNRMRIERSIGETESALADAKKAGRPTDAFEAKLSGLKNELKTSTGELAKLESVMGAGERLPGLMRDSIVLERRIGQMNLGDEAVVKAYRAETANSVKIEKEIATTEAAIKEAKSSRKATGELETRLTELQTGRETSKGELRRLETALGGVKTSSKIGELTAEARRLESQMSPERQAAHREYRATLDKIHDLNTQIAKADAASKPALESERATARGRLRSIELDMSEAPAKGDLGGMLRRIEVLDAQAGRLEARITELEAKGESARALKSELKSARSEETGLRREARAEIMKRFDQAGEDIVALTKDGKPGWDAQVSRLLETRRALQEAYAGDESSIYTAYREMKENARPIGENPRLTQEPYEVPGGEGFDPPSVLKRAEFLLERADLVEAKAKNGGSGKLWTDLMLTRDKIKSLEAKPESPEYFEAYNDLRRLEGRLLREDAFHEAGLELKRIDGSSFTGFLTSMPRFLYEAFTGKLAEMPADRAQMTAYQQKMGLTRYHAAKMLEALANDPMRPAHQRDALMWSYLNSLLFPKGIGHTSRGSSYVRNEIINMVQGFHDNPAGVRGNRNFFNVVHNGQWFESMDNASRRWWELEYGTDLTLPYTHNAMSTIRDVVTNKKTYFISLSGTSGNEFEAFMRKYNVSMVGEGSAMPKNVLLELVTTPEQRLERVAKALENVRKATLDTAVLRVTDSVPETARKAIDEYFASRGLSKDEPQVIKISDVAGDAAQTFLKSLRNEGNTGLIVLSVSDTRALRAVEQHLRREGVKQEEIAKVFADSEHLRLNVPEAGVLRQMNIEGLNTGKVKVLILDTRVGGRGLDLNFKGQRSTKAGAFRGYTKFEMLVLGPQEMSQVHMVQAMGRIDTGRTLKGAGRDFSLLMDIESAAKERIFQDMFENDPFFVDYLRRDPTFQAWVREHGGRMDAVASNNYIMERASDGTGEGALLAQKYEKAWRTRLADRNLEVERNLLRQANVLTDAPSTEGKHPALERIR